VSVVVDVQCAREGESEKERERERERAREGDRRGEGRGARSRSSFAQHGHELTKTLSSSSLPPVDRCYSEFGLDFSFQETPPPCPTATQFEALQKQSPIYRLDAIKTPLLILLGLDDRRVPPSQSKLLYHRLVAKGKVVQMLAFEGQDHALDGVECELIAWEATLRWLKG
jgi:pimeloyl-ACP methyl ester carboxylesterase